MACFNQHHFFCDGLNEVDRMNPIFLLVLKRLGLGLLTLIVISGLIFVGVEALPGDLADAVLGQGATPEAVAAFRKELKLDLPPLTRYVSWLGAVLQGDLGKSLSSETDIAELIGWRLKNTLFLASVAAMIAVPLAVILGLLSALYRNSFFDRLVSLSTLSAISFPEFFVGYILISILSIQLGWFSSMASIDDNMSFWEKLYEIILPALTLTVISLAHMMRMTRAAIINILGSPFIEMAQLKGIKKYIIIVKHALPNVLSPIINVIVMNMAYLVVGVVVVEVIFVYPGLGQLLVDSVSKRDLPVVQGASLIFAATYVLLNLTADILSRISNPRLLHPKVQK